MKLNITLRPSKNVQMGIKTDLILLDSKCLFCYTCAFSKSDSPLCEITIISNFQDVFV